MSKTGVPQKNPHVVIIGAGFGGLEAAKKLRRAPVRVTVIDRSNHHLFQPLLYQVATAGLSPAEIASPIRHILHSQGNTDVFLENVTGIDVKRKLVLTDSNPVDFDYLVIATGATHGYFGHGEWESYAPGLKSIADATKIRRNILLAFERAEIETDPDRRRADLTFCVVGGGPTGVELAGAIAELAQRALATDFKHIDPAGARVVLVEAGPRILPAFSEGLSKKAVAGLKRLKVDVRASSMVKKIDEQGVWIDGQLLPSKTVIWAAGVVASPAGKWLGAEMDKAGRVLVNRDCSVPGHPGIFVIGDTAHFEQDGRLLPGVSPVAIQQGRYVAAVIGRRVRGKPELPEFRYHDKGSLATVGRSYAIAQFGKIHLSGFIAWLAWLLVHIYYLIGFKNRIFVFIQWTWAYFTFQRGARLIVSGQESGNHE